MEKKFELVISYIEELVESDQLKQGDKLPSIRFLAEKFQCTKTTVLRAYKELEMNHKIYVIPKGGFYLVENMSSTDENNKAIDFSRVMPEAKLLPYKEFNHCINRAVELYKNSLFVYSDTQGLESLRSVLVNHLQDYQIFTDKEDVFITSGAQQALSILTRMSFPNGKKSILVEQPTYSLMQRLVELNGDRMIGIKRDFNGIDLHELEEIFKSGDVKIFYTVPRYHNPLGSNYSEKVKRRIVELADKYDVYIIEDDYLADIDTNKKFLPLFYYDVSGRVVYVKSFSKAFMPGIRIGTVVLHENLRKEFLRHKKYYDLSTSVLAQGALEIFINSGMYKKHISKVQIEYKKKMRYLKEYIMNYDLSGIDLHIPETGFFIWMKLYDEIDIDLLLKRLKEKNVYVASSKEFFIGSSTDEKCLRICIAALSKEQIKEGICILLDEINKLKKC